MTTYIIISSIIQAILLYFVVNQFMRAKHSSNFKQPNNEHISTQGLKLQSVTIGWKVYLLLLIALLLIVFSFVAPFILTKPSLTERLNFSTTGPIGDTIGGLMNPFIALASVIVTGLAFYIQYKANLQQRELFIIEQEETKTQIQQQINNQNSQNKILQFESQFYEMLKLHRENVTEMKITGYDFEEGRFLTKVTRVIEGRKIFVTMKTELECILSLYAKDRKLNKESYNKCYQLFFSGLDAFEKNHPEENVFIFLLKKARSQHFSPVHEISTNTERKTFLKDVKLNFNYKPFSGHSSRLGHYFRHLYLAVKSVVQSEIIKDYDEKMKYLRILRAQLSNHEQILLFYNWLSGYGENWENEKNSFLCEYSMIHNLWYDNLFSDDYIIQNVNYLREKEVFYRDGDMYEID